MTITLCCSRFPEIKSQMAFSYLGFLPITLKQRQQQQYQGRSGPCPKIASQHDSLLQDLSVQNLRAMCINRHTPAHTKSTPLYSYSSLPVLHGGLVLNLITTFPPKLLSYDQLRSQEWSHWLCLMFVGGAKEQRHNRYLIKQVQNI